MENKLTSNNEKQQIRSVAVIGAGMAGLTCAMSLSINIPEVTVFDKSRKAGGRIRVYEKDGFHFNYGAQYFTVRDDEFKSRLDAWQEDWLVEEWQAWIVDLEKGNALSHVDDVKRYVGRSGMDDMIKQMESFCNVQYETEVTDIVKADKSWVLEDKQGNNLGFYDAVVIAAPAPQAAALLKVSAADMALAKRLDEVHMLPCWSAMLVFPQALSLGYDAAFTIDPVLAWMSTVNKAPPQKEGYAWVLHAAYEWTEPNLDMNPDEVIDTMVNAMRSATQANIPEPVFKKAHLWKYALPLNPLGEPCLFNEATNIGVCGDWCSGARVEGAFLSGLAMAEKLLESS